MNIPIIHIPSAEYHAESRNGRYLSSHLLADFRQSPELYHREVSGEIAQTESPALALGRAAHCLTLEGRAAFDEQYIVSDGPVNAKTNEPFGKSTKAYSEWLASQTKEVIGTHEFGFIAKLQKSVWLHDAAAELLDHGQPEGVIRTEYCGVPCQIRMDSPFPWWETPGRSRWRHGKRGHSADAGGAGLRLAEGHRRRAVRQRERAGDRRWASMSRGCRGHCAWRVCRPQ